MWVFLNNAMLSIVEDKDDAGMLMVRARLRGDLERTFPYAGIKVQETPPPADYRFRASIPRGMVATVMAEHIRYAIDYTNFKNSVPDKARHDAYLRVWNEMYRAQEDEVAHPTTRAIREAALRAVNDGWPGNMKHPNARCVAPEINPFRCNHCLQLKSECTCGKQKAIATAKLPPTTVRKRVNPRGKKAAPPRSSRR